MQAATSIMRAQQIVLSRVDEALRPWSLTFARYEVLVLLHFTKAGTLPLGKMGDRLMLHQASITNLVDRLEEQGLVRRLAHPTDRRTTLAELTPEGRKVVKA
ncbi:MAG: regulatory protein MarR, partial [Acidimicrobiales bacterium]|nr:regulatory protein MarR [Acidimicrobiales bacterium]